MAKKCEEDFPEIFGQINECDVSLDELKNKTYVRKLIIPIHAEKDTSNWKAE